MRLVALIFSIQLLVTLFNLNFFINAEIPIKKANQQTIIPEDYTLARGIIILGAATALPLENPSLGIPLILLGSFLSYRVNKLSFVFDDSAMEILKVDNQQQKNFFVGGRNRWSYSSFTNWRFYPSKEVPILFSFVETQTKPEGQFHLFPVIINANKLQSAMLKYVGRKP